MAPKSKSKKPRNVFFTGSSMSAADVDYKPFKCEICKFRFAEYDQAVEHSKVHPCKWVCPEDKCCNVVNKYAFGHVCHLEQEAYEAECVEVSFGEVEIDDEKPYRCCICMAHFKTYAKAVDHSMIYKQHKWLCPDLKCINVVNRWQDGHKCIKIFFRECGAVEYIPKSQRRSMRRY